MDTLRLSSDPVWNKIFNLLRLPTVSEVQANGPGLYFIKSEGKRKQLDIPVGTKAEYIDGIRRGLVQHVETYDVFEETGSLFEGPLRFTAGDEFIQGRCHIALPPVSDYPQVTIAKKSTSLVSLEAIAASGSMAKEMYDFLHAAMGAKLTIVVSGRTGAGKTTLLEALTKLIPNDERIGVAEDTPELVLTQSNVSYLHSMPWRPGMDEKDVATLSWVVAQFNRMRTDRLVIGETRGKEFADFLVAANSGMEGSLTTIHANSPDRALDKMTGFAQKGSPGAPIRSINTDIASSVDLVIQLGIRDGAHRVLEIQEVTETIDNTEAANIATAPLYRFNEATSTWTKETGMSDKLRDKFRDNNVSIDRFLATHSGTVLHPYSGAPAHLSTPSSQAPAAPTRRTLPTRSRGL